MRRDLSEERAIEAVAALRRATVVPVDESTETLLLDNSNNIKN